MPVSVFILSSDCRWRMLGYYGVLYWLCL